MGLGLRMVYGFMMYSLWGIFRVWRMGVSIDVCYRVSPSPVSVILRVGGERGCRGIWIMLKVGHAVHVTKNALFIVGIDLCAFEVFLEGGDCSVQDIVDMIYLVSLDLPVFWMGVIEGSTNYVGNLGV